MVANNEWLKETAVNGDMSVWLFGNEVFNKLQIWPDDGALKG